MGTHYLFDCDYGDVLRYAGGAPISYETCEDHAFHVGDRFVCAPMYDPAGWLGEFYLGATYTLCATLPDGQELSDSGVSAAQVKQALQRSQSLGIVITRIIEESTLDTAQLAPFGL